MLLITSSWISLSYMTGEFISARRSNPSSTVRHCMGLRSQICNIAMCLILCSGLATGADPCPARRFTPHTLVSVTGITQQRTVRLSLDCDIRRYITSHSCSRRYTSFSTRTWSKFCTQAGVEGDG